MNVLFAIIGVALLTWYLRRRYYGTPPIIPQAYRAATHVPRLLGELEKRASGFYKEGAPVLFDYLATRWPTEELFTDEYTIELDWNWPNPVPTIDEEGEKEWQ